MTLLTAPTDLRPRRHDRADRWQPTRAGLVNLWRYWDETFTFHRGRLLLRGPNGSGKSMALELLLPFLLDGDASPARLTSATKSRGGLFERVMTGTADPTRTGFAWVEFRKADETFTVGVRLRASASTHDVKRDFFTTTQAIGADLRLLDDAHVPLARKALAESIGDHGRVTKSAAEHREAVRTALFPDFSAERYDALVNALLALRKEKLSQHLDLDKLDEVMSEALPAIDDHEIAAVAEGFERLDRRRDELALLESDVEAIGVLAKRQRAYARAVIASLADAVRSAESGRDAIVRRQRTAADQLAEVVTALRDLLADDDAAAERLRAIGGELEGLKSSKTFKKGAQLADLQRDLRQRAENRDGLAADVEQRAADVAEATSTAEDAAGVAQAAREHQAHAERELKAAADIAGAGATVEQALLAGADAGASLIAAWVRERRVGIEEVRALLAQHTAAVGQRGAAEKYLEAQHRRVDELTAERRAAQALLDAERGAFVHAVSEWLGQTTSLNDAWATLIGSALDDVDGATDAVDRHTATIRSQQASGVAVARSGIEARRVETTAERAALDEARAVLALGGLPEVQPPPWRSARAQGRPGAPLWQLVDVVDGTDSAVIDRVEAALVAAGLADAWVSPAGTVDLPPGLADVVLTPRPVDGSGTGTLAGLLAALPGEVGGVGPATVQQILGSILVDETALEPGPGHDGRLVVGTDGTFRAAAMTGRGASAPGVLFGAAARERHRLAEIDRLAGLIAGCERTLRLLDAEDDTLTAQQQAFDAELAALPARGPCDLAAAALAGTEARLGEADAGRRAAEDDLRSAENGVRTAQRALATRSSTLGIPSDDQGLVAFSAAVHDVGEAGGVWHRRGGEAETADKNHQGALGGLGRATSAHTAAEERWRQAADATSVLAAKVAAIESTIGTDFSQLVGQIGALESEQSQLEAKRQELAGRRPQLDRRQGKFSEALDSADQALAEAEAGRAEVHHRFAEAWAGPLPRDAKLDPPADPLDGVTAILTHARAVAAGLERVDSGPDDIEKLSLLVERQLHEASAAVGIRVDLERYAVDGGWHVVRGSTGGIRHGLVDLRGHLGHQLVEARAELDADEAALFERTLAGSIRQALAERIRGANELVAGINAQLSEVQTAAGGVAVRLRWDVDDDQPDAVRTARGLLLRDPADLADPEREALQEFVRARVEQARAELEQHAPWEARLRESLDYRAWHRFSLQLAHRDWEGFKPATPRLLQRLSTGERSVALHLPMLASIAAHYTNRRGEPGTGPRLILLDELFAGVDVANRAQLFGTFRAWDLDAVFTSDHEWCQYATLDGIAIHHLQGGRADEPVTSTRFTWDGRERHLDDAPG